MSHPLPSESFGPGDEDPDVQDQIDAGWSYSEAEDIVAHDEGAHDSESVPGCPRCEDLYEENQLPRVHGMTRERLVIGAWLTVCAITIVLHFIVVFAMQGFQLADPGWL